MKKAISIHALLAESDVTVLGIQHKTGISIHALLAESDYIITGAGNNTINFYPRSPCGERRAGSAAFPSSSVFLSTLSLRRATAKVHKTVGHFCAYETNFMGIASSC